MRRLGVGLALVGAVATAQAAQPEDDFSTPKFSLLTTRLDHSGNDCLPAYRLSASVVLTRLPDTALTETGFGNTSQLAFIAKPKPEIDRPINAHWQQTYTGGRTSVSRLLRVEFKAEQLNFAVRPNSFAIEGDRLKVTFRSRSALIEGKLLKVMLQPHTVSILWGKNF